MNFNINQKDFSSTAHRSIWHASVFMAPFCEVIPPGLTGGEADELREGEKSLFAYFDHPDNMSRLGYLLRQELEGLFDWFYSRIPGPGVRLQE